MTLSFSLKEILHKWCVLFAFAALAVSCSRDDNDPPVGKPPATWLPVTYFDQAYGLDSAQVMDIYLPPGRSVAETKCIVFIHGGAWTWGDKSDFTGIIDSLRRTHTPYACFNINYRLSGIGKNQYPSGEEDVQKALDYIRKNHVHFNVSEDMILLGASAGAQLAVLHAYRYNADGHIKAAVSLYGVYDLAALYSQTETGIQVVLTNVMGGIPAVKPLEYYAASPVNFVTAKSVPVFILYGLLDKIAPPAQALEFMLKLNAAKVPYQQAPYPMEHEIAPVFAKDAWSKAFAFINKYLPAS
ncbi:Acetyl esterase/lipase [Chitinophaga rupis]|uniref:Acetyl esterase/lipase n=1 Tax=Chitinophaga rupis TaxID=573321 RepID=A0A1H7G725_9BACT|nr:alpha/beta hydrolase [Chitinophaga rupis]SEK34126.1 Acetyl esterase/lipase [Chitinophaga rupis]